MDFVAFGLNLGDALQASFTKNGLEQFANDREEGGLRERIKEGQGELRARLQPIDRHILRTATVRIPAFFGLRSRKERRR